MIFCSLYCPLLSRPAAALAQELSAAAQAYTEAQQLEVAGAFREAAEHYEEAHAIAPTKEALRGAARCWFKAERQDLAATRADELQLRYGADRKSKQLAHTILKKTASALGHVTVRCALPCMVDVDGETLVPSHEGEHRFYLEPGEHRLSTHVPGYQSLDKDISLAPKAIKEVVFAMPAAVEEDPLEEKTVNLEAEGPAASAADERAWYESPALFWSSVGATLVLTGATIWSGVDTSNAKDRFVKTPTAEAYDDGLGRQRRTNALLGTSLGLAAATAAIGIFATKWSRHAQESRASRGRIKPQVGVSVGRGAAVTVQGGF